MNLKVLPHGRQFQIEAGESRILYNPQTKIPKLDNGLFSEKKMICYEGVFSSEMFLENLNSAMSPYQDFELPQGRLKS